MTKHDAIPNDAPLTLQDLSEKLGAPHAHLRDAILAPETRDALLEKARHVTSAKVIIDEQALYNQAYQFLRIASPDQKAALVGVTEDLVALGVAEAIALEKADAASAQTDQGARVASAAQTARAAKAQARAVALRDQATTLLKRIASGSTAATSVDAAHAHADVDVALEALAKIAESILADKKSAAHARAALHNLTPAYVARLREAGSAAHAATTTHVGRRANVTHGNVLLERAVNVYCLGAIVDGFASAHELDATIPHLVPIATRSLFSHHHAPTTGGVNPPAVAPPTAPGTPAE